MPFENNVVFQLHREIYKIHFWENENGLKSRFFESVFPNLRFLGIFTVFLGTFLGKAREVNLCEEKTIKEDARRECYQSVRMCAELMMKFNMLMQIYLKVVAL